MDRSLRCRLPDVSRVPSTSHGLGHRLLEGHTDQPSTRVLDRTSRLTDASGRKKRPLSLVHSTGSRLSSIRPHTPDWRRTRDYQVRAIVVGVAICAGCFAVVSSFGIAEMLTITTKTTVTVLVILTIVSSAVTGAVVAESLVQRTRRRR